MGVADGQPAVQTLHAQQLHPVLAGGVVLGFAAAQVVQRRPGESGVVPEAVAIGDRRGQLLVERRCLHHLQPNSTHRQIACDLAHQPAVCGACADQHQVCVVAASTVVDDGRAVDGPYLGARVEPVPAGGRHVPAHRGQRLSRFDGGVAGTMQTRQVLAAQRRVEHANAFGLQQREAAQLGVPAGHHLLGDGDFSRRAKQRQRAGGPESDSRYLGPEPFPQFACP